MEQKKDQRNRPKDGQERIWENGLNQRKETESLWQATCEIPRRKPLTKDLHVPVLVIGGGMAGILTARKLRERGVEAVVIDADRIGSGVTARTTAKITSQHGLIYEHLIQEFGMARAKQYAEVNQLAIKEFRTLVEENGIQCELETLPAYLYTLNEDHVERLQREAEAAAALGIPAEFSECAGLPGQMRERVCGAVRFDGQAQFHPLKFLKAISEPLEVYEHSKAMEIDFGQGLVTVEASGEEGGKPRTVRIRADQIVMTAHYPFVNVPGYYFARMHQERSYVIALETEGGEEFAGMEPGMYLGVDQKGDTGRPGAEDDGWRNLRGGLSFRRSGELILVGGAGHRTGKHAEGSNYEILRLLSRQQLPGARECYHWSAQDCISMDRVPYIGRFAASTPNAYVATGFRKWGMTGSMAAAIILSDMVARNAGHTAVRGNGPQNRSADEVIPGSAFAEVFSPQRFDLTASAANLMKNGIEAAIGLSKEFLGVPDIHLEHLQLGEAGIIYHENGKAGAYRDTDGTVYLVSTRCPHLGCELSWNPDELSWDCPCHGSRFDYKGNLISGPATEGLHGTCNARK